MTTIKRTLEAIAADFSHFSERQEPARTRQLVRLMDELESDYSTLKMSRRYTAEEETRPEIRLYQEISEARKL